MANKLIQQTWSIRQISPFTESIKFPARDSKSLRQQLAKQQQQRQRFEEDKEDEGSSLEEIGDHDLNQSFDDSIVCTYPLHDLEQEMTGWLQHHYYHLNGNNSNSTSRKRKRNKNLSIENKDEEDMHNIIDLIMDSSNHVSLSWIHIPPRFCFQENHKHNDSRQRQRQRQRYDYYHLHLEIWIQDEPKSQILLCFPDFQTISQSHPTSDSESTINININTPGKEKNVTHTNATNVNVVTNDVPVIAGSSFLLLRGSLDPSKIILQYLEQQYVCHISHHDTPIPFSPSDMTRCLSSWTLLQHSDSRRYSHRHRHPNGNGKKVSGSSGEREPGGSDKSGGPVPVLVRPMEVTFSLPSHLSKSGLEKITMTIPPQALTHLCTAIQNHMCIDIDTNLDSDDDGDGKSHTESIKGPQPQRQTQIQIQIQPKEKQDPSFLHSTTPSLPILRALQCYIMEAFRIDVRSFSLARAACGVAALSCDGRCKPLDPMYLHDFLVSIQEMMQMRVPNRT